MPAVCCDSRILLRPHQDVDGRAWLKTVKTSWLGVILRCSSPFSVPALRSLSTILQKLHGRLCRGYWSACALPIVIGSFRGPAARIEMLDVVWGGVWPFLESTFSSAAKQADPDGLVDLRWSQCGCGRLRYQSKQGYLRSQPGKFKSPSSVSCSNHCGNASYVALIRSPS